MQAETTALLAHAPGNRRSSLQKLLPAFLLAVSRGAAVAAQMAAQIVVGALAGAAGLGVLQLFTSWTCIAGEVLAQGLPPHTLRSVAVNYTRGDADAIRSQLADAVARVLRPGLPLMAILMGVTMLGFNPAATGDAADYTVIAIAVLLAAPLFSLLRLAAEALKGTDAPLAAVTLENLVPPALILLACLTCWLLGQPVLVPTLLLAGIAGFAATLLGLWIALRRRLKACPRRQPSRPAQCIGHDDLHYLWANSVLSIAYLHLPFLLLPWFATAAEIGNYAVAHKLINVVTTLLILLAAVFGPAFARAAAAGDYRTLRSLLRRTQVISTAIYLPFATGLLLASTPLATLFNLQADTLRPFLLIMGAGHLVNAVTGLPGVMLNMAGAAAVELYMLAAAAAMAVLASLLIGPLYGAPGLACVFSATVIAKNLASHAAARHFLDQRDTLR